MPSKHALLSASASHRWLNCTPSMRLELTMPDEGESSFAAEGTRAHSLCEAKLQRLRGVNVPLPEADDSEMDMYTDEYRDFVEEEWNELRKETKDASLYIEQSLIFGDYVPEGFGTSDAVLVSDKKLVVIDFKYGKGVSVDAVNNPQLRLYGLGAYLKFSILFDFDVVKTVVFQPRIGNITSEEISVEELLKWADEYVKPRAQLAFEGKGDFITGEHCRFCKAGSVCRARAEEAFTILDHDKVNPPLLSDDEIPPILDKLESTLSWIEAIKAYALERAIGGKKWQGYKLVESRTQRKIPDQIGALKKLNDNGYDTEDVTNTKLKGLTDLQKVMGKKKFEELLSEFIVKPQGSPTLVDINDKREEISPVENAFKEEI